jgi:hypothetical protein
MSEVISLNEASQCAHIPLQIDVVPTPPDELHTIDVFANRNLEIEDARRFDAIGDALQYAAALSAKHECPIFPHGAAADHLIALLR